MRIISLLLQIIIVSHSLLLSYCKAVFFPRHSTSGWKERVSRRFCLYCSEFYILSLYSLAISGRTCEIRFVCHKREMSFTSSAIWGLQPENEITHYLRTWNDIGRQIESGGHESKRGRKGLTGAQATLILESINLSRHVDSKTKKTKPFSISKISMLL